MLQENLGQQGELRWRTEKTEGCAMVIMPEASDTYTGIRHMLLSTLPVCVEISMTERLKKAHTIGFDPLSQSIM